MQHLHGWLPGDLAAVEAVGIFHYDRGARQAQRLFSATLAWEGLPFVTMEPVIIRTLIAGRLRASLKSLA